MKKSFKLSELDCANCAAKMEAGINKLKAVEHATISFMTKRLTLECAEEKLEEVLGDAQKVISKIERDCKIVR